MIDGPIKDVGDAYAWIKRGGLQDALRDRDILVDADRVVVVGWSTGGHLAMTTAWTCQEAGLEAPVAILSFYGPTDFESGGKQVSRQRRNISRLFLIKRRFGYCPWPRDSQSSDVDGRNLFPSLPGTGKPQHFPLSRLPLSPELIKITF